MAEFLMPKLGADMSAGTLVCWRAKPGDRLKRGDVIAEVETDKGVIAIEVFSEGILEKLLVQPGERIPIGMPMAVIQGPQSAAKTSPTSAVAARSVTQPVQAVPPVQVGRRVRISPSARSLAHQLGVDLDAVHGSGPDGAITREDVERSAKALTPPTTAANRSDRMRQTIAAAMSRSKREIPHYYLCHSFDMNSSLAWLQAANEIRAVPDRLVYGVLVVKAVALALRNFPDLNGFWNNNKFEASREIHVGIAISLRQGGLMAPAIHNTDVLSLDDLMHQFRDLVQRTRLGSLRSSELSDPTITITSLGEQGVQTVLPVIYPPQVAIVGFGKIEQRPWVVDDQIVPRPIISSTLAADHRVSDGHRGGLFLAAVAKMLQEPGKL